MIKYIVKFLLVILIAGSVSPGRLAAQDKKDGINYNNISSEDIEAFQEASEEISQQVKNDFDKMYQYQNAELGNIRQSNSYKLYQQALEFIDLPEKATGSINDPGLKKDYNTAYEGSISSSAMMDTGELSVAWSGGHPIVITSEPQTFERTMYVPQGVDRQSSSFKRLIYHMHVFDGDNGFGLSDVKAASDATFARRAMVSMRNFRKKHFARGVDVKIVSVNTQGEFTKLELSKKPKYMSAQYLREWWGAMNHGRPATRAKVTKAFVMAGLAGGLSALTTNTEMASVMAGLALVSYTYYEGYLTFKFNNSPLMQILKLSALTAFTGTLYTLMHYGFDAGDAAWIKMFSNVGKSVALFYTASYAKRLLVLSGKVKKMIPISRIPLPKKMVGKKINFLGVSITMPESVGIGHAKMSGAKIHDMIQDSLISLGRQADLVYDMSAAFIPAIFAGLHAYAQGIYYALGLNKKPLDPLIENVNNEVFYKKFFKNVARSLSSGCRKLYSAKK